jgi:predicted enzyme related to lactoylglutathione lyase
MSPASSNGKICYIEIPAVDIARSADAEATVKAIVANGGEIVQPIGGDAPEITARFRDPGGNLIGIYQERGLEKKD